jgi:molybdopterin converting factor small subunit
MATKILFFGALREIAGTSERIVDLPDYVRDSGDVIDFVAAGDEGLRDALSAPAVRIAVDRSVMGMRERFSAPSEIAFMPPFSGG